LAIWWISIRQAGQVAGLELLAQPGDRTEKIANLRGDRFKSGRELAFARVIHHYGKPDVEDDQ